MRKILFAAIIPVLFILPASLPAQGLTLEYSTYLGGTSSDYGYGITVDSADCAYVAGYTYSSNFPTLNPYQGSAKLNNNCFITKFESSGSSLVYSTTLGGSRNDYCVSIDLDGDLNAYLGGYTDSVDFPTFNPYQASFAEGTYDSIVTVLSSSGSSIRYSTYLGGSGYDRGVGIEVDEGGDIYCAGYTDSVDFPTINSYQDQYGGGQYDAFFTVFSRMGGTLKYSTYLGGDDIDQAAGIAIDSSGWAYIGGKTASCNFPTFNSYQGYNMGGTDLFIARLLGGGESYSTFLGGDSNESAGFVTVGSDDCASILGLTWSNNFPTENPYQSSRNGSYDLCYAKLSSSGSALIYSSYLGGGEEDYPGQIALDSANRAVFGGYTISSDFPTRNPYQPANPSDGDYSGFALKMGTSGSSLIYSTYLGGGSTDIINGVAVDEGGHECITGYTGSTDFPTANPYQSFYQGSNDVFITKFLYQPTPTPTPSPPPTPSPTLTPVPTLTAAPTTTPIPTATSSPTLTPVPTLTPAPTATPAPTTTSEPTVPPTPSPPPTPWAAAPPWISDYNGDGTSDIAIFRESSGLWAIRNLTRVYFGTVGDSPRPQDYSGNGTTDIGIYRETSGLWAVRGLTRFYFGGSGDLPVPADYGGDGTGKPAIFRPASGLWAFRGITRIYFGGVADEPVPGYYEEDSAEAAIFRPASGLWAVRGLTRVYFGNSDDSPAAGDYAGTGFWRAGIFRSSSGLWALREITRVYFGGASDTPVQADYDGTGTDEIGIFRSSSGLWAIRGVTRIYFGRTGDQPVTR